MSGLTIQKEIQKKEYEQSPLGKLDRQIHKIYDDMILHKEALSEPVAKQIYDLRDKHEKEEQAYIDMTLKRDKDAVDKMLFDTFTKELEILNNNYKIHD
jgi:hypothetical protein